MIMSIEIIKLLRRGMFSDSLLQLAADTIEKLEIENNSQKTEIERLKDFEKNVYEAVEELRNKIKAEAVKEFAEAYKDQIEDCTGMFTDEGFYIPLDAVLNAVNFIRERMAGEN